jgi:hypothetical protein
MRNFLKRAAAAGERHLSQRSLQLGRFSLPGVRTADQDQPVIAWSEWLIFFFRALAIFQLCKGLVHWGLMIGVSDQAVLPAGDIMEMQAANIYFAVLDLVAGVGLWLTSSWGAVLWLLTAMSQIAVLIGFPEIFGTVPALILFEVVAIGVYLFLTWKVAHVSQDKVQS